MTTAMTSPIWIGASQAADSLGISISTIYRWRSSGLLKPGIHWRRKTPSTNSPSQEGRTYAGTSRSTPDSQPADWVDPAGTGAPTAVPRLGCVHNWTGKVRGYPRWHS